MMEPGIQTSPLQEIFPVEASGVRVFIKRDDLLFPEIQGNKWRKLAPFLHETRTGEKGILSFGGAFSNHLHALANAGRLYGFPTIGIVRGAAADLDNPTLAPARQAGMQVFPVPKTDYDRLKGAALSDIFSCINFYPPEPYLLLPEGGDTIQALVGCTAIAVEILDQLPPEPGAPVYFCVPAGTGCTAAGVIAGAGARGRTLVFPAAPYGVDREHLLSKLIQAGYTQDFEFQIVENILPRKFAKMTGELRAFVSAFHQQTGILLDPVYTAKMMFRLYDMLAQQFFPPGSCVVALHTGGLQGWGSQPPIPGPLYTATNASS